MKIVKYDDDLITEIDKEMGWDETGELPPSAVAESKGYHVKFLGDPFFGGTAWCSPEGLWSVCVLRGRPESIGTTLLAKSFDAVNHLYKCLILRDKENKPELWNPYYRAMWERRYRQWCCKSPSTCECQLCRTEKHG